MGEILGNRERSKEGDEEGRDLEREIEEEQGWKRIDIGLDMRDLWDTMIGERGGEMTEKSEK